MASTSRKSRRRASRNGPQRTRRRPWLRWNDERLLDTRLCDLNLRIKGTFLEECIEQIHDELAHREIRFRPHFWLSEEWFSPDGVPGVAIPFFLAHPRLMRLERKQMLEVEGGSREWCMRIMRHEVGHALDHAYLIHRRRRWQQLFGKSSQPYPEFYSPKPYSRRFVLHLDSWYAQSHPDEDFAETFAVWLKPQSNWKRRYQGWPVMRKLEYVDELMAEIAGEKPKVRSRATVEPIRLIRKTLRTYYEEKKARYSTEYPDFYDHDLRRLFTDDPKFRHKKSAASFLRRIRSEVREMVSAWTGEYEYTLEQVLKDMIGRCRDLKLRAVGSERQLKMDFAILLTVQTMNYLHSGRHRVGM